MSVPVHSEFVARYRAKSSIRNRIPGTKCTEIACVKIPPLIAGTAQDLAPTLVAPYEHSTGCQYLSSPRTRTLIATGRVCQYRASQARADPIQTSIARAWSDRTALWHASSTTGYRPYGMLVPDIA
eukprot:1843601-Rhodomonas_salina.1